MNLADDEDDISDEDVEKLYSDSSDICDGILDCFEDEDWSCHAEILGSFMAAITVQILSMKCLPPDMAERFAADYGIERMAGEATWFVHDEVRTWLKREAEKC